MDEDCRLEWVRLSYGMEGIQLQRMRWRQHQAGWDQDHCVACNATFADFDHSEVQREGFTTCSDYVFGAEYHWVCDRCFADLKGSIGWTAVEDPACESKR